jgi:beta-lactamase class A
MRDMRNQQFNTILVQTEVGPPIQARASAALSCRFNLPDRISQYRPGCTRLQHRKIISALLYATCLFVFLELFSGNAALGQSPYPDLRDAHSPVLQKALDKALDNPVFWSGVKKKELSIVVADVTDLQHPKAAWYNPNLMLYAASLPKIAIVLGVFVEIDRGVIKLDSQTRTQLIRTVRYSSNRDATTLLHRVGFERLAEILQDERHGKLYDPARGGGLWVGKEYGKAAAWRRDPLHGISHGASAMQAARFYYGVMTGTIIDIKYLPLFKKLFGNPAIKHKFVKGLEGREDVEIFRKSGTWRDHHADSGIVARKDLTYIAVYIDHHPEADRGAVEKIQKIDDVMLTYAKGKR